MLQKAETMDYHSLLSTEKEAKAATSWFLRLRLLNQFSLAKEMRQEDHQEESKEESQEDRQDYEELGSREEED